VFIEHANVGAIDVVDGDGDRKLMGTPLNAVVPSSEFKLLVDLRLPSLVFSATLCCCGSFATMSSVVVAGSPGPRSSDNRRNGILPGTVTSTMEGYLYIYYNRPSLLQLHMYTKLRD
jgi:hypothetical protein